MRKESGFTLIETLVVVATMAIVVSMSGALLAVYAQYQRAAYIESSADANRKLGQALQSYAANENLGRLPDPYTGGGYVSTVYDPNDALLAGYVTDSGVYLDATNDDGFASQRVRVFQKIELTKNVPFMGAGGELVDIDYDFGVIYQTDCSVADGVCNPSATGIPSDSAVLTVGNYRTWTVDGNDLRPYAFNTYGIQRAWLSETRKRLEIIRDALRSSFSNSVITGAAGDVTNWYVSATGIDESGKDILVNQGCHDGWYDLSDAGIDVLEQLNISPKDIMGVTAWGGSIEYCRDYDPAGLGADSQPHGAALRINRSLSDALSPSAVAAENLVIGF